MKLVKKEIRITKEEIFKLISSYDIYRYYFGEFTVNRKYLNHLRGDKEHPSFAISNRYEELTHIDFGNDYWRGNCINLVQQINRCDFQTALNIIDKDFNLGIGKEFQFNRAIITWKEPKVIEKKPPTIIQVDTQKFTKLQLDYWNGYELSLDDIKNDVYSIRSYYINKEKYPVEDLTFGYLFEGKYWKIYKPYNKKDKWKTNCPITTMYGLENINKCKNAFIVKSKKDELVMRKFISSCTCGTQNESKEAISDDNITYIRENSEHQYVIFDNEDVGVKASVFYNDRGFGYWNVPKRYYNIYGIKDPSDFVYRYGGERLRKEVNKKIQL